MCLCKLIELPMNSIKNHMSGLDSCVFTEAIALIYMRNIAHRSRSVELVI